MSGEQQIGIELQFDMSGVSPLSREPSALESFAMSIAKAYEFEILAHYVQLWDDNVRVYMVFDCGYLVLQLYGQGKNKVVFDLFVDKPQGFVKQMNDIKRQAHDFFAPQLYMAQTKPRGQVRPSSSMSMK